MAPAQQLYSIQLPGALDSRLLLPINSRSAGLEHALSLGRRAVLSVLRCLHSAVITDECFMMNTTFIQKCDSAKSNGAAGDSASEITIAGILYYR